MVVRHLFYSVLLMQEQYYFFICQTADSQVVIYKYCGLAADIVTWDSV